MRVEELACRLDEDLALCRQTDLPRRAFDQPRAQPVLQPLQLDADRALRGPQHFSGAGETAMIRDHEERTDRVDFQRHVRKTISFCCH